MPLGNGWSSGGSGVPGTRGSGVGGGYTSKACSSICCCLCCSSGVCGGTPNIPNSPAPVPSVTVAGAASSGKVLPGGAAAAATPAWAGVATLGTGGALAHEQRGRARGDGDWTFGEVARELRVRWGGDGGSGMSARVGETTCRSTAPRRKTGA